MGTLVSDAFNRANNATSLGTADTGQTWVVQTTGATFGISTNQAYEPSGTAQATAVIDSTVSDCTVKVTTSIAGDSGPCFRATDANNYWMFANVPGGAQLWKVSAGSFFTAGAAQTAGTNGDVIEIDLSGSSITVIRNGTTLLTVTDSFNSTATKHGLRVHSDTATRLDNFSVTTAGGTAHTQALAGALSFSGAAARTSARGVVAGLSFTGSTVRQTSRAVGGVLRSSGTVATLRVLRQTLTAGLSFAGAVNRRTAHVMTASLAPTGSVRRAVSFGLTASLATVGTLNRSVTRTFAATLGFVGSVASRVLGSVAQAVRLAAGDGHAYRLDGTDGHPDQLSTTTGTARLSGRDGY